MAEEIDPSPEQKPTATLSRAASEAEEAARNARPRTLSDEEKARLAQAASREEDA